MKYYVGAVACIWLVACSRAPETITVSGNTQGTTYHFTYWVANGVEAPKAEKLQDLINNELVKVDIAISNYRPDSIIEKFNANDTLAPVEVPDEVVKLINIAREIHQASNGCYDLTIKPLFDLWGFKADIFHAPSEEELANTLTLVGFDKLVVDDNTHIHKTLGQLRVDMSSIGQGYTVGRIAAIFDGLGIHNYLVEIGGEMQVAGNKPDGKPWRLALDKPLPANEGKSRFQKLMQLNPVQPISVMTSGTYRHFFDHQGKRYSHILDARTGKPVEHNTVSVTVWYPESSYADAWSTAFLCLGREAGMAVADKHSVPVLFIEQTADGLRETSSSALNKLSGVVITDN